MFKTIDKEYFLKIFFRFLKEEGVYYPILQRIKHPNFYLEELRENPEYQHLYIAKVYVDGVDGFLERINKYRIESIFDLRTILPFEYGEFTYVDFNSISQRWRNKLDDLGLSQIDKIDVHKYKWIKRNL